MTLHSDEASFCVTITAEDVVQASQPPSEPHLRMSHLDKWQPKVHIGVLFCYKKKDTTPTFDCVVATLKRSLSEVLVLYYVFAGEVVIDHEGEPEIMCSNRGVEFSVARANVELRELDLHEPDRMVGKDLMPVIKEGVFAVQVTEFKCGGTVMLCCFDHRVADAYSTNMFLVSWAETASLKPISVVPSFCRSRLQPQNPPRYKPPTYEAYVQQSNLQQLRSNKSAGQVSDCTSKFYYVSSADIELLQQLANNNTNVTTGNEKRNTKLESFSALLWKKIARCTYCKDCAVYIAVDGRSRFAIETTGSTPPLSCYFGNVVALASMRLDVETLKVTDLSHDAELIHDIVRSVATEEHFLGVIDWLEAHKPGYGIHKAVSAETEVESFVVSSGLRFPLSKVDFGWGKPTLASYYAPIELGTYVMPSLGPLENGDWLIFVNIDKKKLQAFENEFRNFLHPLTAEYLDLI